MFTPRDAKSTSQNRVRGGIYLFAAGSIAAGILDLIWGDFEAAHQPIQALGDHIPGREILAYIAAIWLVGGGGATLWREPFARAHRRSRLSISSLRCSGCLDSIRRHTRSAFEFHFLS